MCIRDRYAIGAAQRTISLASLRNMEVAIHTMDEQIKIVEQLTAIDKKIIINHKINDNLAKMIKDTYNHMFVCSRCV